MPKYALLQAQELVSSSPFGSRHRRIKLLLPDEDGCIEKIEIFSNIPTEEVAGVETIDWTKEDVDIVLLETIYHLEDLGLTLDRHRSYPIETNQKGLHMFHDCQLNLPESGCDIGSIKRYLTNG